MCSRVHVPAHTLVCTYHTHHSMRGERGGRAREEPLIKRCSLSQADKRCAVNKMVELHRDQDGGRGAEAPP